MKIKKFNESFITDLMDNASVKIGRVKLNNQELKTIHRSGRKCFTVDKSFNLVEVTNAFVLNNNTDKVNDLFPYVLIIHPNFKEKAEEYVGLIKRTKEISDEKISTMFEMLRALSQKFGMTEDGLDNINKDED